jgi:hypothetical protein
MNDDKYNSESKSRLLSILRKKLMCSFIGALDRIEKSKFGELIDKPEWEAEYENLRREILNNGNQQIRAIEDELNHYTVHWERYQVRMPVLRTKEDYDKFYERCRRNK